MSTEVDNKQILIAAPAAEDKPATDAAPAAAAPAVAADESKDKPVAAVEGAGGDASKEEATDAPAKEEDAVAADKAAPAEAAPAKPEPPVKYNVHRQNFEKDIVYLYQFSRTPVLPSLSPYCLKVETWLRLAGLKYENVDHKTKYRSKKGLLPFIELNGEEIADSALIIKDLSQRFEQDIDACLTQEQKNIAHATISMIENHLVWVLFYWRTKNPDMVLKGYKVNLQHALGTRIPNGILNFFFKFAYGRKWFQGAKKVKAQGMGVHKPEEIEEFGKNDLKVLSDMLADKPFYFGDEPTTLDIVSFAVLSQLHFIEKEVALPLRDYMSTTCPNLVGHVSRMKERCFPDWDEICTKLDLNAHLPKPVPEAKEGKEADAEKKNEQENGEAEKELEKDKAEEPKEKIEENKEKEEAAAAK